MSEKDLSVRCRKCGHLERMTQSEGPAFQVETCSKCGGDLVDWRSSPITLGARESIPLQTYEAARLARSADGDCAGRVQAGYIFSRPLNDAENAALLAAGLADIKLSDEECSTTRAVAVALGGQKIAASIAEEPTKPKPEEVDSPRP